MEGWRGVREVEGGGFVGARKPGESVHEDIAEDLEAV